jgi:hypothetical protein
MAVVSNLLGCRKRVDDFMPGRKSKTTMTFDEFKAAVENRSTK